MAGNIVICSDGTGNAGGKHNGTNVWRLFLAIDHDPPGGPHQMAFYDDGVGSDNLKYSRMIGGAFGWGISRNLTQMMGFLLRQYRPGDKLYLFGFSRGAFTIRALANMIRLCGIPDCSGKSPDETNECAEKALRAYKRRDPKDPDGGRAVHAFRTENSVSPGATIPIEFIGVWDTVEALGLPFEEMKRGLRYLFRLRMRERERELYPNVRHARHALSVDDERVTFRPLVWNEAEVDPAKQTIKQVWFPGVHANVGGGYAKDQLALISLNWMMAEAGACGLRFYLSLWDEYKRDADVDGQIYDSRAGLGAYYRYQPRRLEALRGNRTLVTLHESVLQRISLGTDDYAPDGVPQQYDLEPPGSNVQRELHPDQRAAQLEIVQDVVWWREVVYALFVMWTVTVVVLCWAYRAADPVVDIGTWPLLPRLAYHLLDPVLGVLQWVTPTYFEPGVIAARRHPLTALAFILVLLGIQRMSARLRRVYRDLVVKAWRMSLPCGAHTPGAAATVSKRSWWMWLGRSVRHSRPARTIQWLWVKIAPRVTVVALLAAILWICGRYFAPAISLTRNPMVSSDPDANRRLARGAGPAAVDFDTRNSLQPTPFVLVEGEKYRIRVTQISQPWQDKTAPADPDGVKDPSGPAFTALSQFRRDPGQSWLKLMGSVGPDLDAAFPIGSETYYRAPRTGRLYLFVNDTLLTYCNNQGTGTVEVECVTPDAPFPSTQPPTGGR